MSTGNLTRLVLLIGAAAPLPALAQSLTDGAVLRPATTVRVPTVTVPGVRLDPLLERPLAARAPADTAPDEAGAPDLYLDARDDPFPDSEAGRALHRHMVLMSTPAPTLEEARERVAASLERLRADPAGNAGVLAETYERLDEGEYLLRWTLMRMLADLETGESRDLLAAVAHAPLPPERLEDTHYGSTRERELTIRLRAVEGLSALARAGDRSAEEDLLKLASRGEEGTGVQLRAIKGYLSAGGDSRERAALLSRALPESLHDVLTVEVTSAEEFEARNAEFRRPVADGSPLDPSDAGESRDDALAPPKVR